MRQGCGRLFERFREPDRLVGRRLRVSLVRRLDFRGTPLTCGSRSTGLVGCSGRRCVPSRFRLVTALGEGGRSVTFFR